MTTRARWTWIGAAVLVACAPFLLFPESGRALALLALPLLLVGNRLVLGQFVQRTPYDIAVGLILLMVGISLWATYDLSISLSKVTGLLLGVATLYVLAEFAYTPARFRLLVAVLLLVQGFFLVASLLGTDWSAKLSPLPSLSARVPQLIAGLPGAEGGFHPNELGGALTWLAFLPFATAIGFRQQDSRWHKQLRSNLGSLLLIGLGLATLALLVLTQSRSAWVGVAAGLATLATLSSRRARLLVVAATLVLLLLLVALAPATVREALLGDTASSSLSSIDLTGRPEIWSRGLYGIQDFAITGMGMGTFREVVHLLYPLFTIGPDVDIGHAHNELLQAGLDLGIPGMISFAALQILGMFVAARTFFRATGPLLRWTSAGALAGLVAHAVYGLTDAVALGAKPGVILWALLALIAAAATLSRQREPTNTWSA